MTNNKLYYINIIVLQSFIFINAVYIGKPSPNSIITSPLKHSLELICQYTGPDDDGEFIGWFKDGISVNDEKPGHYVVKSTPKESKLIIKIFVKDDGNISKWSVHTNKKGFEQPKACQFNRVLIKPSPQAIETNRTDERIDSHYGSVRRVENEKASFKCVIQPSRTVLHATNKIKWTFSKDDQNYNALPDDIKLVSDDEIIIENVQGNHRGYYRCELNDVHFTVLLRVKDRLAALWPFLGIVAIVLILVVIIFIFEKRGKPTKGPTTTNENTADHANDPLIKSSQRGTDNESKTRTAKA